MIETWKNDFMEFVNSLNLDRDDYKTMMEYIDEIPAVQPDHVADVSKKVADEDCISRQAAIYAAREELESGTYFDIPSKIEALPAAQPDRAIIDDCLHHIYKNISVHTATGGVITIKHYMQALYEEIYGKGERPWWMT